MRWLIFAARTLAIIVEQDYFSFPQYELYFSFNDTSSLNYDSANTITVGDVKCILPNEKPSLQIESQPKTLPSTNDAARLLESMGCLFRIIDGQYWAYQFCYGKEILQFHPVEANSLVPGDQFSLGSARKMSSSAVKEKKLAGHHQVYLEQVWEGGSVWFLVLI
jgi:hypothetical protein